MQLGAALAWANTSGALRLGGTNGTDFWSSYCGGSDTELHSCLQSSVASVLPLVVLLAGAAVRAREVQTGRWSKQPGVVASLLFTSICLIERWPEEPLPIRARCLPERVSKISYRVCVRARALFVVHTMRLVHILAVMPSPLQLPFRVASEGAWLASWIAHALRISAEYIGGRLVSRLVRAASSPLLSAPHCSLAALVRAALLVRCM
jgi:hypothetical protein